MHRLTISDLDRLGSSSGFGYRLPLLPDASAVDDLCVVEGQVRELQLRPGMRMVLSSVTAHHHYDSSAEQYAPLSVIIMLRGEANTRVGRGPPVRLGHQVGGLLTATDGPMVGSHAAGQHMRSVNLSFDTLDALDDPDLQDQLAALRSSHGPALRPWVLPEALRGSAAELFEPRWQGSLQRLLGEGVALQMLAHALQGCRQLPVPAATVSPRDRQRLQQVCERLLADPGAEHTLHDLARLACMSPSSLRSKFQAVHHCSLFTWLRQRRLEIARDHLLQGLSVQEAAQLAGYRHPGNFATAYRARFGRPPSKAQ